MSAEERRDPPPNPYAPPAAPLAAPAPVPARGGAGATYVVDADRKIPPVCLKCGTTAGIVRRQENFAVSPAARGIGVGGGAVGAVVANATRHDSELMFPLLGFIGAVLAIVVWVLHTTAKRVHLALPLCAACNERWNAGRTIRRWLLVALGVATVCLILGLAFHSLPVGVAGAVALAVMIIVAIPAKLPARFVGVQRIDGTAATLTGVSPAAIALLEEGGPPKKKAARRPR
jgi:hypothetical protein